LRIRSLVYLDFTNPDEDDSQLGRLTTALDKLLEPELTLVPLGNFVMGSSPSLDKYAGTTEFPQHRVFLPDFHIARTPTTNGQYFRFVSATKYRRPQHWTGDQILAQLLTHPVTHVSWDDAQAYCRWLSDATGKNYRLPTEAEWEKAARGAYGSIYPWGNRWNECLCNTRESGIGTTTPVGTYPAGASPYGIFDCAGNVWEWCGTREGFAYPSSASDGREDPTGDARRVLRGGSWFNGLEGARSACRYGCWPTTRAHDVGFRVVVPSS